jgi:hypothetical protein
MALVGLPNNLRLINFTEVMLLTLVYQVQSTPYSIPI